MKNTTEPGAAPARILIVEDQEIVSEGLRLLLDQQPGLSVIGVAAHCKEALAIAKLEQPDIALLDINLGDEFGLNCLNELMQVSPSTRALVLTGEADSDVHFSAIVRGAFGLVGKNESYDKLIQAVRSVGQGDAWMSGKLMSRVLREFRQARATIAENAHAPAANGHSPAAQLAGFPAVLPPRDEYEESKITRLTEREKEVIQLIGLGLRNQQIADRLFISVITVRHHLSSVFNKLDVSDRFELAIYSYRHGLAKPPI
jgi:DNA-binding NarL/FixJ family response regulator